MATRESQPGEYHITELLFNRIDDLSSDMQFNLYQQLIEDRISVQLFKLILDMSDEEKIQILEILGDVPFEAEPVKTINLDENESAMRENNRKSCLVAVKCKVGDTTFTSYIINISVHGVFIESNEPFSAGQGIQMIFKLPNTTSPLELKGRINRAAPQGIGVNFLDVKPEQQEIIRAYIGNNQQL